MRTDGHHWESEVISITFDVIYSYGAWTEGRSIMVSYQSLQDFLTPTQIVFLL